MDLIVDQAQKRGIACLTNLHQVDIAREYSTRILGIRNGKLVYDDTAERLTDEQVDNVYNGSSTTKISGFINNNQNKGAVAVG
jgi:phosphonate transport system ATP-binding protein